MRHGTARMVTVGLISLFGLTILATSAAAFQQKRNITVRVNKTEVVYQYALINARFEKEMEKCQAARPPTIVVTRKPKLGKVKVKNGVKFDSPKNSGCKGKKVLGSIVEFTSNSRGKTSFKIDVLYRQGGYYDHKFGDVTFNVTVR